VIGMKVMNVSNQEIGKGDNLMINLPAGRIAYVILNPDRSLALGNDYYALPPSALTLSSDRKNLVSDINKEKLAAAPHFAKNNWPTLSDPAWAAQVYQYYGKQAYFDASGSLRPTSEQGKERIYQDKK
jgi:PRC-barrel domain.